MVRINKFFVIYDCSSIIDIITPVNKSNNCDNVFYLLLNFFKGFEVIFNKIGFQEKVFRRVTCYRKLRECNDLGTGFPWIPLPPEQAAEARRKAMERARKKGYTASQKTLSLSGWLLIFTSLPMQVISTSEIAALYRVRWQVELVIKRMKSLLDIDRLRAYKGSDLAELYLHGKLLYAAITHKISHRGFGIAATTMLADRSITPWRLWRMIADEIKSVVKACFPRHQHFVDDCIKSLSERPRKRRLQGLPTRILTIRAEYQGLEIRWLES